MDENQKVQEALDAGFTIEQVRAAYLANNRELPSSLQVSEAETTGKELSKGTRLGMTALQGPTLGFADELAGLVGGGAALVRGQSPSQGYQQARDIYRSGVESYKEEQPIGSAVAQGAASLPLNMLNLGRSIAPNVGPVLRSIGSGLGFGIVGGAGEAKELEDVPVEAAKTGATSAVLGGLTEVGMKAVRPVKQAITSQAGRIVPESVRDYFGTSSVDLARRRVAQAMLRDGATTDQVAARMSKLGDDAILAESSGYNTRDL
jgi:hypothetical protein